MADRIEVSGARPDDELEPGAGRFDAAGFADQHAGGVTDDEALGVEDESAAVGALDREDGLSRGSGVSSRSSAADAAEVSRAEDHALVRRAQAGDERAFEGLVRRHQSRAWRVARNLVASDEDAHDLAQEAFLRVFRNLSGFDFQHGFTTWLYRIVTNLAIDLLRKRRTALSTTRTDPDEGDYDLPDQHVERPSDGLERAELAQDVRACLGALAPHFQSVLMLREMEGLPCNEIAHIVGATHVTVRWRLHRGRKLFQEEWERRKRLAQSGTGPATRANSDAAPIVGMDGEKGEGS